MSSYLCPFCGRLMSVHSETYRSWHMNFLSDNHAHVYNRPHLEIEIYKCPSEDCRKESILAHSINGYFGDSTVNIFPQAIYKVFPEYVPLAIRSDYQEACSIIALSPKAAATLARRCLQGMIHDFWDVHEKNLNAEITALKNQLPVAQWKAIDALRSMGNIGAHMEHDVNRIIEVDPQEASLLLRLIEHLIEKWYIARHEEEALYSEVAQIALEKELTRKA